jgi:heme/copper-type cytochrome/quinol oxidase subunit 2
MTSRGRLHRSGRFVGVLCALGLALLPACGDTTPAASFVLSDGVDVVITGADYRWTIRYAGPDGCLGTPDDRLGEGDLHLPAGHRARLTLHSLDYIYTLDLPAFGAKQIAVPEMDFTMALPPRAAGRTPLQGDEMCGIDHPDLRGSVIVHEVHDYERVVGALPRGDALHAAMAHRP